MDGKRAAEAPTDPVVTARLVLTPIGRDDVADLAVLYGDPVVAHWTGPWTRSAVEAWTATTAARWAADGVGKASRAVMERLGMRPAGVIRREGLIEGRIGVHPDAPFALYRLSAARIAGA